MSRAIASFTFDDGVMLFGLYNGTVDYMQPFMADSTDEAWEMWRVEFVIPLCDHDGEPVEVINMYGYGDGERWVGRACRSCRVFKGPFRSPETSEALD